MAEEVLLDELPTAAVVVAADRRITAANASACELLGRPLLDGVLLDDLLAPVEGEDAPWLRAWDPAVGFRSVTGFPEQAVALRRADGSTVAAVASGRYRRAPDGALTSVVIVLRPVRPRGRHTPSGMEVVSTVSHELRSPLTSVKGFTSLLLNRWDRIPDDQKQDMLRQINQDADRVTRLITELLDISRLETGRLHLRRQDVDLVALATAVLDKVAHGYPDLDCAVSFPADFPTVYADPDKLEQVLTNLVENAAKYASPAGMRIEGLVAPTEVAIAVHDRGEGIPAADLPRVFSKFFRRDLGRPTGSGLGLWISRGLVEAHGGRLTASSIEGHGSVFRFTLPTDAFDRLHGS